jgi:hypothetical protein
MSINRDINSIIQGIRVMMAVEIKSVLEEGRADEETVASLRKRIKERIFMIHRLVPLLRRELKDEMFSVFIYSKFREILEIVGDFKPYGYPACLEEWPEDNLGKLCNLIFRELQDLLDWTNQIYGSHFRDLVFIPEGYRLTARYQIREYLFPAVERLLARGADPELLTVITHPYNDLSHDGPSKVISYQLVTNLKKLYKQLYTISHDQRCDDLNGALRDLLYTFNVNTREAVAYSTRFIQRELDGTDSVTSKLEWVAYHRKLLQQLYREEDMIFEPQHQSLVDQLVNFINVESGHLSDHDNEFSTKPMPDDSNQLILNHPNEHYAAVMRVLHDVALYLGTQMNAARQTARMFRSKKNTRLGELAHEKNFKNPKPSATLAAWTILMRAIVLLTRWGKHDNIPDLRKMSQQEITKLFSDIESSFPPEKPSF